MTQLLSDAHDRSATRPARPSVLVVDDHELVAIALAAALRDHGFDVHPCRPDLAEVIAEARCRPPALVLLDLALGRDGDDRPLDGANWVRPLRGAGWRVLILTGSRNREHIAAAITAGASGWVPKSAPFAELVTAVCDVATGRSLLTRAERLAWTAEHEKVTAERQELRRRLDRLTLRERQVLDRLAAGRRAAAVAEEFVVSLVTVRSQIHSILTKLEVCSQLEAVALLRARRSP